MIDRKDSFRNMETDFRGKRYLVTGVGAGMTVFHFRLIL